MNLIEAKCRSCSRTHARQVDFERLGIAAALEAWASVIAAALPEDDRLGLTTTYLPLIQHVGGYYLSQVFDRLFHPVRHLCAAQPIAPQVALALRMTKQDARALAREVLEQRGRVALRFSAQEEIRK